jgi:hypothetical protein
MPHLLSNPGGSAVSRTTVDPSYSLKGLGEAHWDSETHSGTLWVPPSRCRIPADYLVPYRSGFR